MATLKDLNGYKMKTHVINNVFFLIHSLIHSMNFYIIATMYQTLFQEFNI